MKQLSTLGASAQVRFPQPMDADSLRDVFSELASRFFEISSLNGRLLGHVKVYGEWGDDAKLQSNVTGSINSLFVRVEAKRKVERLRVWINIITYMVDDERLRERFIHTLNTFSNEHNISFDNLKLTGHKHE